MSQHRHARLGDHCDFVNGGTPSKANPDYWGGDTPWITSADIREGAVLEARSSVTSDGLRNSATNVVPAGTILLVSRTGVGKVAQTPMALAFSQDITAIVPKSNAIDARYLLRFLETRQPEFERNARGATIKGITRDLIASQELALPPLDEQRRIAAILDKADALRQKRRRAIALLDSLTQSIFLEMFGDPESNPIGWPEVSFGDLILEGPTNGLYRPASDYGSGTPIVRIDAFYDGVITGLQSLKRLRIDAKTQSSFALRQGDVVINRVNSLEYLGKSALVPALSEPTVFESNMMRIRLDHARVTPGFCVALLQADWIKKQIARSAKKAVNQASINQTDVKSFSMFLPPLTRQVDFEAAIVQIDRMKHRVSLRPVDNLFSSLQHRAFSGQL